MTKELNTSTKKTVRLTRNLNVEKIGGWRQLSESIEYDNPWIQVQHHDVLRPNGTQGIYGVVHFKHAAVAVIALDESGDLYLVSQSRYALDQTTWELPEGGASEDEDVLSAAKRELEEEVGLIAAHWQKILTLHLSNSVTNEVGYVFLAQNLISGTQKLDETEDIDVKKVPLADALVMVLEGEITDAMSVAGILWAERYWRNLSHSR